MADQDYPHLYADMEASAQRARAASIAFEHVLGGPAEDMVPVNGWPAQPTVAGRIAGLTGPIEAAIESAKRFAGSHATAPTVREDGSPLQIGDEYFNTTSNLRYSWDGGVWAVLNANVQQLTQLLAGPTGGLQIGYKGSNVGELLDQASRGPHHIRPSLKSMISRINGVDVTPSTVITGDSLAIGGYAYDPSWPVFGGGYATQNPFGLSSWPQLIRDLFVSVSPAFIPIADVQVNTDAGVFPAFGNAYDYGINGKSVTFSFNGGSGLRLEMFSPFTGSKALLVSYAPAEEAVLFTVDGVEFSNQSPNGNYQSRGYMVVPCTQHEAVITNVRRAPGNTADINLPIYGMIDANRRVPALTGKGAWTSGQILAEYDTLVAQHAPELIFYIVGANDIALGVSVETYIANVKAFITRAKAERPACEVVLISPPPSSSYPEGLAMPYIQAARILAETEGASFVNLYLALKDIDPSRYRHDNIHFTRAGEDTVFTILRSLVFPEIEVNIDKFLPAREALLGVGGFFYPKPKPPLSAVALLSLGPTIDVNVLSGGPAVVATYVGADAASRVHLAPPPGYIIVSVSTVNIGNSDAALHEITGVFPPANDVAVAARKDGAFVEQNNVGMYLMVAYSKT